jgi:hypothetical protein
MKPSGGHERSFDRVEIEVGTGKVAQFTSIEFQSLPLDQRVRAILSRQLRFFRGDCEITIREALRDRS